jgi:hypothetical protein
VAVEKFELSFPQRRILPVSLAIALAGAVLADAMWLRLFCGGFGVLTLGLWLVLRRAQPCVVLDEQGYAVEEFGKEKLRVAWSDVVRVRADPSEHAVYVDCGDPAKNLLVPPSRGWGFRFPRARELYARIVGYVPDKVEVVERLDPKTSAPPSTPPA